MGRQIRIWKRLVALAFAYVLVAQAALVGFAHQAAAAPGFDLIICQDAGGSGGVPGQGGHVDPFSCCGVGCLAAAHLLASPGGLDVSVRPPSAERIVLGFVARTASAPARLEHGKRPRGPPAVG